MNTKKTMKPVSISGPFQRLKPEIFNPYEVRCFEQMGIKPCDIAQDVTQLPLKTVGSDGTLYSAKTLKTHVYIYKIPATCTLFKFDDDQSITFCKESRFALHHALAFFDKGVIDDQGNSNYFFYRLSSVTNGNASTIPGKWNVIPREFFSCVNDYVYLFLCCKNASAPVLKTYHIPFGVPFFWDLPVATAIFEGQKLSTSKILLGQVMELPSKGFGLSANEKPFRPIPLPSSTVKYTWNTIARSTVRYDDNKTYHVVKTNDYTITYNGKKYSGPEIEVCIFQESLIQISNQSTAVGKKVLPQPITAFVWQSGNEDDAVKKSFLQDDPYNKYPFIHDSLSSTTIFGSLATLTRLSIDNAARYAVKTLARQCPGYRSFSVDGDCLVHLMGGAIYKAECIEVEAYKDHQRDLTEKEVEDVNRLFELNGNHLFFDSEIHYDKEDRLVGYLRDVLGIVEGSNGCKAIAQLLSAFFKGIAWHGLTIDYLYCDIEGIWNEARSIASRRFSERYLFPFLGTTNYEQLRTFYNEVIWKEVMDRKDVADDLLHRGYYFADDELGDVFAPIDNAQDSRTLYGIQNAKSYEHRRNVNVWDAVMKSYTNRLFYEYVFKPAIDSHPKIKCSVFAHRAAKGYVNRAERFETYLGGSVSQNPAVYSNGSLYGSISSEGYMKLSMDNWRMFPNEVSTFSYFMGNINKLRSLLVSTQDNQSVNGKFNVFISSCNIWINGYISKERCLDDDLTVILEQYYKEFLYHVFLSCPDKAIAYFNVENKAIGDSGLVDEGGTYYFPYGSPDTFEGRKQYYQDSYGRLQSVLESVNGLVKGRAYKTTVRQHATESDPFVISGVSFPDDTTLWRITWDVQSPCSVTCSKQGLTIKSLSGRQICFSQVLNKSELTRKQQRWCAGIWVVASKGILPSIISDKGFFERVPAFVSVRQENEKYPKGLVLKGNHIDYQKMHTHTVFGEMPKMQTVAMRFKLNAEVHDFTRLLWSGAFTTIPETKRFFEIILGSREGKGNGMTLTSWKGGRMSKTCEKKLVVGKMYELVMFLHLCPPTEDNLTDAAVRYELWSLNNKQVRDKMMFWDECGIVQHKTDKPFFLETLCAVYPYKEEVSVESFKCYFTEQHEKLELFRESDGVNIGRVNKRVSAYQELAVGTTTADTLVAKLSWLNASDQDVVYKISYYQMRLVKGVLRDKKMKLDVTNKELVAKAGSEGSRMIPLSPLQKGVRSVRLECTKTINCVGRIPVQPKKETTTFFTDYFEQEKKKVIVVDIMEQE